MALIKVMEKVRALALNLIDEALETGCAEAEKRRFTDTVGKIILTCSQVVLQITKDNSKTDIPDRERHVMLAHSDIERWESLLRDSSYDFGLTCSANSYSICSEKPLAKETIRVSNRLEVLIDRAAAIVENSDCSKAEKQQYLQVYGMLITVISALPLLIYLDHDELIPDDEWRETVEDNRRRINSLLND